MARWGARPRSVHACSWRKCDHHRERARRLVAGCIRGRARDRRRAAWKEAPGGWYADHGRSRVAPVGGRDREVHDLARRVVPAITHDQAGGARERGRSRVDATPLGHEAVARVERGREIASCEDRRAAAVVEDLESSDEAVHPAAQRRPGRAVPSRDPVRYHAARTREETAGVERRPPAVVVDGEREDAFVRAAAERGPGRAVPARDPVRRHAARAREVATGVEPRPASVVEGGEGVDAKVRATAERGPGRAVPLRDAARWRATRAREVATGIERRPAAVVENGEGVDASVRAAAERGPGRAIPARDVVRDDAAGAGEE